MAVTLSIRKAVELLEDGYVRWRKDEVEANKSIQSYFGLNTEQMKNVLKRSELKQKRTTDNNVIFEEDLISTETTELVADSVVINELIIMEAPIVNVEHANVATTIGESELFN